MTRKGLGVCLLVIGVIATARVAFAGGGRITPGNAAVTGDCDDPRTPDEEICRAGERAGDLRLEVNFRAPPLQPDFDQLVDQMKRGNKVLCDATDGQVRIRNVHVTVGESKQENGDIWWFPNKGRARTTHGHLGHSDSHVEVFLYGWEPPRDTTITPPRALPETFMRGDVIAHELGHLVLGLFDEYSDPKPCGGGPGFDQNLQGEAGFRIFGPSRWERPLPGPDSERSHTLMQNSGFQACARASDLFPPAFVKPGVWDFPMCLSAADCVGDPSDPSRNNWGFDPPGGRSDFSECPELPLLTTELATQQNYDLFRASFDQGSQGAPSCPGPKEARELVVNALLRRDDRWACGVDADGDGDRVDPALGEECDGSGSVACDNGGTGTMSCEAVSGNEPCRYDRVRCGVPSTCNGSFDPAVDTCDGGLVKVGGSGIPAANVTCSQIGLTGSGPVTCNGNCTLDTSQCSLLPYRFPLSKTTLNNPHLDHVVWREVSLLGADEDEHRLVVYFRKYDDDTWIFFFGADGADYTAGVSGKFLTIATYLVDFDGSGNVEAINGVAFDPDDPDPPALILGSETEAAPYGVTPSGVPQNGQTLPTGLFSDGGSPVRLDLRFNLTQTFPTHENGQNSITKFNVFIYPRHGTVQSGPHQGKEIPQARQCTNGERCFFGYRSETEQFESATDFLRQIHLALKDPNRDAGEVYAHPGQVALDDWRHIAAHLKEFGVTIAPKLDRPVEAFPAADCPDPTFTPDPFDFNPPDEVVVALDRSGSMDAEVGLALEGATRLDFAVDATKAFFEQHATRGVDAPEIGLILFSDEAFTRVGFPNGTPRLLKLVDGSASSSNEIGTKDLRSILNKVKTLTTADDDCSRAGRQTAIGDALAASQALLPEPSSGLQSVLLLSDGEENRFHHCSDNNPVAIANDLSGQGVQFYWVPTGKDKDKFGVQNQTEASGGYVFSAENPAELPPKFMQIYARQHGESLARSHLTDATQETVLRKEFRDFFWSYPIEVEAGAARLNVLVSLRRGDASAYDPDVELIGPGDTVVTPDAVKSGPLYRFLTVRVPAEGTWKLRVPTGADFPPEESFVTAHVEHSGPDCFADVQSRIIRDGDRVLLSAQAFHGPLLGEGAEVTARIHRPDDSVFDLSLSYDRTLEVYTAEMPQTQLRGRGPYSVVVRCKVPDGTLLHTGEPIYSEANVPDDLSVDGFTREVSFSFFYDTQTQPPLPGPTSVFYGDCDGDTIPDADEAVGDSDGDGIDDVCDSDGDGDEVWDGNDPDPTTPTPQPPVGCRVDRNPPVITAEAQSVERCFPEAAETALSVSVSDDSCTDPSFTTLSGRVLTVNGSPVEPGPAIAGDDPRAVLPVGTTEVEWTATDVNGNVSTATQVVTVLESDTAAACCQPSQTLVLGNSWPNVFVLPLPNEYCVFGRGGVDTIVTGLGPDLLSGGAALDYLTSGSALDVVLGRSGSDVLTLPVGNGTVYGGDGHDVIEVTGGGTIYGNRGDDAIVGAVGNHFIYPGPGRDSVETGVGNDTVTIFNECELEPFEVLDGGLGVDTLVTPLPVLDLIARGVVVLNFENVVVTGANRHLAECF